MDIIQYIAIYLLIIFSIYYIKLKSRLSVRPSDRMRKFSNKCIAISSVKLNFQNRRPVELTAGSDRHLTVQILNCMNSFLCLFKSEDSIVSSSYFLISIFKENFLILMIHTSAQKAVV